MENKDYKVGDKVLAYYLDESKHEFLGTIAEVEDKENDEGILTRQYIIRVESGDFTSEMKKVTSLAEVLIRLKHDSIICRHLD